MIWELPDVQAEFRTGRGNKDQIANIRWIIENAREFQENICFCFTDYTKAFNCVKLKDIIFIPIPKKSNAKECANYCKIALISHASKIVLKILQARLQQYAN